MAKTAREARPPGQRLLYWLAHAATAARNQSGQSREVVAGRAGVVVETVRRFEKAERWPQDHELLLAAYADVIGLEDPRDIYQAALDLWYEHGSAPMLGRRDDARDGAKLPSEEFLDAIREGARRDGDQSRSPRRGRSSATRKRSATG